MNDTTWTTEQLLGMAPDHLQVNAAETAAKPDKWLTLGANESCAWGEFSNNQNDSYHAAIGLPHMGLTCDCPSRKLPCRHSLSLSLLLCQRPDLFIPAATPTWVNLLQDRAARRQESLSTERDTQTFERALITYQRHLDNVKAGLRELELWLRDMIHQGVAALTQKTPLFWRQMANRLIDAQAYETAKELLQMASLPGSRSDWPETVLRRCSRLYLLTQGFTRYDSLPPEAQADLRYAVGWFVDPQSDWSETQRDTWLVLGKKHELMGRKNLLRVWLWGSDRKRPALLIQTLSKDDLQNRPFVTGTSFNAALHFYPSAWPVRAHLATNHEPSPAAGNFSAYKSLEQARRAYGRALSLNPWLRHFPLLLQSIQIHHDGQRWSVHDEEGYTVPLPKNFLNGWHLKRVTQTEQCAVFGEWDGRVFQPLSINNDGRWLDLHTLRGVK